MRSVYKNVSWRRTDFFCWFCWNDSARSLFLLPLLNCFFSVCLPTLFAAALKIFLPLTKSASSSAAILNNAAPTRFAAGTIFFAQKRNCSSPINLCKCTKSPSTFSTNASIKWSLYLSLSWSNQLVTSFRLEKNDGGSSEHQNKTNDTNRCKGYFCTARVSQVNLNTMKKIFKQRSGLQVAKCLIVHVLSSSYNVSSRELRNVKKATQQWSPRVANDIVLNQVLVYHEIVYADNVVSKFWFVSSPSSQYYPKHITTLLPRKCPRSILKNARPDSPFAR